MQGLELICFEIISSVGAAKSSYIEAIQHAKAGDFAKATSSILEGDEQFQQGHHAHAKLIQQEANNEKVEVNLLLVHAEDQLMGADTIKIIALELIDILKKIS